MKPSFCEFHPSHQVFFVCLQPQCVQKIVCLLCTRQHSRHDLISFEYFTSHILPTLNKNRNNPQHHLIYKKISATMDAMLQKLHLARNKLNGLLGSCEDKIQKYFGQLLSSFMVQSQKQVIEQLQKNLSSQLICKLLQQIKNAERMALGTLEETNSMIYYTKEMFDNKVNQMVNQSSQAINSLTTYLSQISLAKPPKFQLAFSRQKLQKGSFKVSDQGISVQRFSGNGSFPLCLGASPFSPLNDRFSIKIQKSLNNRSICFGACLQNVVKANNYSNCCGIGKGIYGIDQNSPYSSGTMMASWNHHDTQFNQSNVGSNDLIGWTFVQGETITIHMDYYNGSIAFYKELQNNQVPVYQMPIKLDSGPIYPFVSMAFQGDTVRIVEFAAINN